MNASDKLPLKESKHDIYDFVSPHVGTKDAARGKNVLITGGGTGIGEVSKCICANPHGITLTKRDRSVYLSTQVMARYFAIAGAVQIVLAGRRPQLLGESKARIDALGLACNVVCVPTDIANADSVASLIAKAGRVHVLINNAGSYGLNANIVDGNLEEWWPAFETNIKGTYLVTQAWLRSLNGGPGVVINVSSRASHTSIPGTSSYHISKSALNRFTEYVAMEHADQGVVAIAFHPGGVASTDTAKKAPERIQARFKDTADLGGATAVYLSSPRAAFLSGRFLNAQWDMEELEKLKDVIVGEGLLRMRIVGIDDPK